MIVLGTVNLSLLASALPGDAKISSNYKRLQRFIKETAFCWRGCARIIATFFGATEAAKWALILDRTNWKLGKTDVNILYLAIARGNMSFPIIWKFLEGKSGGNSDHFDRIDVMECFVDVFGNECIEALTADREFIGKDWLKYIDENKINYVIRLKENGLYISNSRGKMVKIKELLRPLGKGESVSLGRRKIGKNGERHCVCALRNLEGELVVVIHSESIKNPIEIYKKRWEIETMFKAFKSSGFDMESTHVTDYERLNTLFSVMAIAFCLSFKVGEIANESDPIPIKSHGRKAHSVFKKGLILVRNIFIDLPAKRKKWDTFLKLIIPSLLVNADSRKIVLY
jgi:hypothetical protein